MPVGPSHSRGGSHSGGSFSSRSSSSSSRSSFVFINGAICHSNGKPLKNSEKSLYLSVFFGVIAFVGIICTIIGSITANAYKNKIQTMKDDSVYYYNLIETGERVEANISRYVYYLDYNGYEWYYIEYWFNDGDKKIEGETYVDYSLSQAKAKGDKIVVYYNSADGFSINEDYRLESVEYKNYISCKKGSIGVAIFGIVAIVAGVFLMIVFIKKGKKQKAEEKATEDEEKQKDEESRKERHCEYCGTVVGDEVTNCPNCGAKINARVKPKE